MTVTIGIDPGKSGAIAFLDHGRLTHVADMPVVGNIISPHTLTNIITWNAELTDGEPAATYIDMMRFNVTQIVDGLK